MADLLRLSAAGVDATVDLVHGGRIASMVIDGREILVTGDPDLLRWGAYPMAPYAGRVRNGRFTFRGRDYTLPLGMPPHAIHGTAMHRSWRRVDASTIETELGPDWPFAGRVVQHFALEPRRFEVRMELRADEPMPASIGWHPWFLRRARDVAGAASTQATTTGTETATATAQRDDAAPVELDLDAGAIYERDADGIATRRTVPPPPGPWDECFTDLRRPPVLRWPGFLELTIESDARDWVVYTEPEQAICVEPQTAPPGALDDDAALVEPGAPLITTMTWTWRSPEG